jgi:hypothetical protein
LLSHRILGDRHWLVTRTRRLSHSLGRRAAWSGASRPLSRESERSPGKLLPHVRLSPAVGLEGIAN